MKKYFVRLMIGLSLIAFVSSCDDDNDNATAEPDTTAEQQIASDIAFATAEIDEIYRVTDEAFTINSNGRVTQTYCANVSLDRDTKTITLDYGDGCESPVSGVVRKGIISITYTGTLLNPGNGGLSLSFTNYEVNGVSISGTTSMSAVNGGSFQRTNNLTVGFEGEQVTYNSDLTYEWVEGAGDRETFNEVFNITGTASGTDRKGNSYNVSILQPWRVQTACFVDELYYPVSGTSNITITGKPTFVFDFGNGNCDKLATISVGRFTQEIILP